MFPRRMDVRPDRHACCRRDSSGGAVRQIRDHHEGLVADGIGVAEFAASCYNRLQSAESPQGPAGANASTTIYRQIEIVETLSASRRAVAAPRPAFRIVPGA